MALPPWLNITPSDYLRAVEAGTQAGLSIRQANERAWEAAQRMEMEQQAQQQRQQQLGVENAANRLAQERLEAYRQGELKNAQARLAQEQQLGQARIGIEERGLGLRGEGLEIQRQRAEDLAKSNEQRAKDSEERERDRQAQRDFMNDMRDKEFARREREMERAKGAAHFFEKDGIQYVVEPGSTNAVPVNLPKKEEDSSSGSLLDLWKGSMRLGAKLSGLSNFLPEPTPAASTNAASVPSPYPLPNDQAAPPPSDIPGPPGVKQPLQVIPTSPTDFPNPARRKQPTQGTATQTKKKRVKVKGPSGQSGTIEEGDTLPEGWKTVE